jgi:DNA polymerase-3 subunit delta
MPRNAGTVPVPPVSILYGRKYKDSISFDEYLAGEHVAGVRTALGGESAVTSSEYDASQAQFADCLDEVSTPSMWGGARLVILRRAELLIAPPAAERERLEPVVRRIAAMASSRLPSGYLVLVVDGIEFKDDVPRVSFAAAKTLIEAVAHAGGLVSCIPPREGDLKRTLSARASKAGFRLAPGAADALIQIAGTEQMALQEELDKLLAAAGEDKIIAVRDVESLAGERSQASVFTLADKILDGDVAAALSDLAGLREVSSTAAAPYIVNGLCWSFRRYLSAAETVEKGKSPQAATAEVQPKVWFAQQAAFAGRLKRWDSKALLALLDRALACDVEVKTGTVPEAIALETFVADASRRRFVAGELVGRWLYEV